MSEEMQENKIPGEGEGREPGKSRRRRRRARSQDKPRTDQVAVNGASPTADASSRPAPDSGAQAGDGGAEKKGRSRRRKRKTRSQQSTQQQQQPQPQKASARKSRGGGDGGQRERRRGGGGGGGGIPDNIGNRANGKQQAPRRLKTPESKFGGREPRVDPFAEPEQRSGPLELTPFELFCAYHLGIADDNRYRQPNLREVARRFACSPGEIESALKRFGMDRDSLRKASYDISLAQLDIQVAPDGIDKRELAKVLFSDFLDTAPHAQMLIEAATRDDANATERVAED